MAYYGYGSQQWDVDPGWAAFGAALPPAAPAPARMAVRAAAPAADADDWSEVLGDCHAHRPGAPARPAVALPPDDGDWGIGLHAI